MVNINGNPAKDGARKIVMIIAFKDFKDEEYFVPREIFDKAGMEVKVTSNKLGTAQGIEGGEVNVDIKLSDLNVSEFDAIVFIGGSGAPANLDNQDSYGIAKDAMAQNKLLAAICISPAILAKAGILNGKKATVWTNALNKDAQKVLEENGAIYQKDSIVQDGKIITADGPEAAKDFAEKILDALK
ncbi:MAG: DJ-1/PfpI family protein [bacterium]|nr:DJ-1/PfpI family protein [bacterium]